MREARLAVAGADVDEAIVVERRGGSPPWVRAGIGSVVAPVDGWAAVAGSSFVAVFDLHTGDSLLRAEFDPRPIGGLWLGTTEGLLVLALPDGDVAVFAPGAGGDGSRQLTEVSRHGVGEGAAYATCGDVLAVAQAEAGDSDFEKEDGTIEWHVRLYRLDRLRGRAAEPFLDLPLFAQRVETVLLTTDYIIAECVSDDGSSVKAWRRDTLGEPILTVKPPDGCFAEAHVPSVDDHSLKEVFHEFEEKREEAEAQQTEEAENEDEMYAANEESEVISNQESLDISEQLWASRVERRLQAERRLARNDPEIIPPEAEAAPGQQFRSNVDGVVLLTFSRRPRELDEALFGSSAACAASDRGVNTRPEWAHGAKVFVEGLRRELLAAAGVEELCPRHVLVNIEDEDSIHAALQTLSYRVRPRLKPGVGRRELGYCPRSGSGGSELFRNFSDGGVKEEATTPNDAADAAAEIGAAPDVEPAKPKATYGPCNLKKAKATVPPVPPGSWGGGSLGTWRGG